MEDQNSIIVGSLHIDVWGGYLDSFVKTECKKFICHNKLNPGLNVVQDGLDVISELADSNPSSEILLVYWPLELYPFLIKNCVLEPRLAKEWNYSVSHYLKLKRKYTNRLKLLNGMHLFPEFRVDGISDLLCSKVSLFESVKFHQFIFAKDGLSEFPSYIENLDVLNASESNVSHSQERTTQLELLKSQSSQKISEALNALKELQALKSECNSLNKQLEISFQNNLLAEKEAEQLKQQVLLLQSALESQFSKMTSIASEHHKELAEKEKKFLEKEDSLANQINNLRKELNGSLEQRTKLEGELQKKDEAISELEKSLQNQRIQNTNLQEHLVQTQIHIEKTHETFLSQLSAAESKFTSERKSLSDSIWKLQNALEVSHQQIAKLREEHEEQSRALNSSLNASQQQKKSLKEELASKTKALLHEKKQRQRIEQKLTSKLETLEEALSIAESSKNILEYEYSQLRNSKYWKLLAPAKSLKGRLFKEDNGLKKDMALLYTSNLFDAKWYLECYKDVEASGLDPAEHYLKFGFKEGRQPGPNFDGNWYLKHYDDVAKKGANPLIHFIKYGQAEGRRSSPRLLGRS